MTARSQRVWGTVDVVFGAVLAFAVFRGLPARSLYVDIPAGVLAASFAIGGGGLVAGQGWARKVLRVTTLVSAGLGAVFVVLLCFGMGFLAGVHAPVGSGGVLLGGLIVLLLIPYLIVFPAVQHWALREGESPEKT